MRAACCGVRIALWRRCGCVTALWGQREAGFQPATKRRETLCGKREGCVQLHGGCVRAACSSVMVILRLHCCGVAAV